MTKRLFLLFLLCLLLPACDLVQETETETHTTANDFTELHITSTAGAVNIGTDEGAGSTSEVQLTAEKFAWGVSKADAQSNLSKIDVGTARDGDIYTVTVFTPWDNGNYDTAVTGGVNLTFSGMSKKKVLIETKAGAISCDHIAGGDIQTAAGTVSVAKCDADLTILSSAGAIDVKEFTGSLFDLEAEAGSIGIDVAGAGEVNGSIMTTAGVITLGLSKDLSCLVDLAAEVGTISIDGIDEYDLDSDVTGTTATFELGGAEGWISAETTAGAISATIK